MPFLMNIKCLKVLTKVWRCKNLLKFKISKPPLQEDPIGNNYITLQQNENGQQEEEHEDKKNRHPLGEILPQNLPVCKSTRPHRPCEGDNNIKEKSMQQERKSLHENKTWDLVECVKFSYAKLDH